MGQSPLECNQSGKSYNNSYTISLVLAPKSLTSSNTSFSCSPTRALTVRKSNSRTWLRAATQATLPDYQSPAIEVNFTFRREFRQQSNRGWQRSPKSDEHSCEADLVTRKDRFLYCWRRWRYWDHLSVQRCRKSPFY